MSWKGRRAGLARTCYGGASLRAMSVALIAGASVGTSWAQANASAPRPFVEEQRQLERERTLRQQQEPQVDERLQGWQGVESAAPLPTDEAPCFRIDRIKLSGEEADRFQWLLGEADGRAAGLNDPPAGRCLGTQGINTVMARLQQALVARGWITSRVLAAPQDLSSGSLVFTLVPGRVAANSVDMQLSGDVINAGTIAGRELVKIDAANIQNLGGRISGAQVQLKAKQDIDNIGGTIDAATRLSLEAGRDVHVVTTTTQGGSTAASGVNVHTQGIDRIAGLYASEPGGKLSVQADQDVVLQGAQVQSKGSVDIEAGRDILLGAVSTGEQLDARWNKNNTRQSSVTQSLGTTISAQGGDASLHAGRDLKAEAAKLSASDTLKLEAKGAIDLSGVIDQQSAQTYEKRKNGLDYYSLDASSQDQSLNRTELQAGHVQIKSGGDTKLAGTTIDAETLDIHAGGKLILPTTTTQDSEGWNVTHVSSALWANRGGSLARLQR